MVWGLKKPPIPIKDYMFDNKIVFTKDASFHKMYFERQELSKLGLPIKSFLNYWSDTTGECHTFPVFKTDLPIDIVNRYYDLFPAEFAEFSQGVKDFNDTLHSNDGMSKERTNMAKLKVPIIVYKALVELDPDFWMGTAGLKWIEKNVKQFKVGK